MTMVLRRVAGIIRDAATWIDPRGWNLRDRVRAHGMATRVKLARLFTPGAHQAQTVGQLKKAIRAQIGAGSPAANSSTRLVAHEMRRAREINTVARAHRDGRYVRYSVSTRHPKPDECDDRATRNQGYGAGVYPAQSAPVPPIHIGCLCYLEMVDPPHQPRTLVAYSPYARGMLHL